MDGSHEFGLGGSTPGGRKRTRDGILQSDRSEYHNRRIAAIERIDQALKGLRVLMGNDFANQQPEAPDPELPRIVNDASADPVQRQRIVRGLSIDMHKDILTLAASEPRTIGDEEFGTRIPDKLREHLYGLSDPLGRIAPADHTGFEQRRGVLDYISETVFFGSESQNILNSPNENKTDYEWFVNTKNDDQPSVGDLEKSIPPEFTPYGVRGTVEVLNTRHISPPGMDGYSLAPGIRDRGGEQNKLHKYEITPDEVKTIAKQLADLRTGVYSYVNEPDVLDNALDQDIASFASERGLKRRDPAGAGSSRAR